MARNHDLVSEIERGALDSSTDLADLLRKCIALGGETGSAELRAWASRELRGYGREDEVPRYRITQSQLYMDAAVRGGYVQSQQVPYQLIPDEARETVLGDIKIHQPVAELVEMVANAKRTGESIKLGPPHPTELVVLMNQYLLNQEDPGWKALNMPPSQVVERVYWQVPSVFFTGVLDTVRTTLVELVAEMRAGMPQGESLPSAEVAEQALSVAVYDDKNRVVVQRVGTGGGAAATTGVGTASAGSSAEPEGFWRRWMWWLVGFATIAGAVAAVLALHPHL